jgi:3-oxoacyl-(acyl-carrier-protein) synthase
VDWGRGDEALAAQLRRRLEAAGVAIESIDRVVSGASGAVLGDRLEGLVLRRIFGTSLPPLIVPKAVVGEYGGAALGAAVLHCAGAPGAATPGFAELDPELEIAPHDGSPLAPPRRVLVSALAAGGSAAWLLLDRAG